MSDRPDLTIIDLIRHRFRAWPFEGLVAGVGVGFANVAGIEDGRGNSEDEAGSNPDAIIEYNPHGNTK